MMNEPNQNESNAASDEIEIALRYESNPKHSEPWQPGRKGSICDQVVRPHVLELLKSSELDGQKRYAVLMGRAYCAQEHQSGVWHGYPIGWIEVPCRIKSKWKDAGSVTKRDLKRYKESHT